MKLRKIPQRMCVACRTGSDKQELVRVVCDAERGIHIDPTGKSPGRGAYVCPKAECVARALKQKRFDKALRAQTPATLAEELEAVAQKSGEG